MHLFLHCRYTQEVWVEVCIVLGFTLGWQGGTVLEAFQHWWGEQRKTSFRAIPVILAWGIWISRNKSIFQDCRVPIEAVAAQVFSIVQHFRTPEKILGHRMVREEQIDKSILWGYFDGASLDQQMLCGGGEVLHKYDAHYFHFSAGLGRGTNNYAELMTLRLLLLFSLEHGCLSLQVFGDSSIVIDWENEITHCHVMRLLPILEEILRLKQHFIKNIFTHVYRERNGVADQLSKEAMQLDYGIWRILVQTPVGTYRYYHRPFHEAVNVQD